MGLEYRIATLVAHHQRAVRGALISSGGLGDTQHDEVDKVFLAQSGNIPLVGLESDICRRGCCLAYQLEPLISRLRDWKRMFKGEEGMIHEVLAV